MKTQNMMRALDELEKLVDGFHAVKQIRAFAAEENVETKRNAKAKIAELRELCAKEKRS